MTNAQPDWAVIVGLVMIGAVSVVAVVMGGNPGLTVAAAGVGGIGGWLTRGAQNRASTETGNVNVTAVAPKDPGP